jgi:hypothetical protein
MGGLQQVSTLPLWAITLTARGRNSGAGGTDWERSLARKRRQGGRGGMSMKQMRWGFMNLRRVRSSLNALIGRFSFPTKTGAAAPRTGLWVMGCSSASAQRSSGTSRRTTTGFKSSPSLRSQDDGLPTFVVGLRMEDGYGERR